MDGKRKRSSRRHGRSKSSKCKHGGKSEAQQKQPCARRDLGIKWLQRHTLAFEEQTEVDMRTVCPKDAKKMLLKRARQGYWKRWVAKHEYDELKEGVWLEPRPCREKRRAKLGHQGIEA